VTAKPLLAEATPPADGPRLQDAEVVFVDSMAALEAAWAAGLPRSAEICTTSPTLLMNGDLQFRARNPAASMDPAISAYHDIIALCWTAFNALDGEGEARDLALVAAQCIFRVQSTLFKFMALCDDDLRRTVAVIDVAVESGFTDRIFNTSWYELLADHPRLVYYRVPRSRLPDFIEAEPASESFLTRLRFADWQNIGYRVTMKLWNRLSLRSPRGSVLIFDECDLLKETAFQLALRGLRPLRLSYVNREMQPAEPDPDTSGLLRGAMQAELEKLYSVDVVSVISDFIVKTVSHDIATYRTHLQIWREQLVSLAIDRPRAVFANKTRVPEGIALCRACHEQDLLVAVFEHGACREIGPHVDRFEPNFETASGDVFFGFNPEVVRITNASRISHGTAVAVGAERAYKQMRAPSTGMGTDLPPIWYVSTHLYSNNIAGMSKGLTDLATAKLEMTIVDEVLAHLPSPILYKPYPWSRYPDPDPVVERVRQLSHVTVYEERGDFRYMVGGSRVIVTSRPTSTLAWCLYSGRPVVYLDLAEQPLTPEAREALEPGLFLFDEKDADVWERMREFLCRPLEEIDVMWAERAAARERALQRFFSMEGWCAGRRAATTLLKADFRPAVFAAPASVAAAS
jgi:hypothetical protein